MRARSRLERTSLALLAGALCTLAACSLGYFNPNFLLTNEAMDRVEDAASRYNNSLRFGNLEMAARWVKPELRRTFLQVFGAESESPIRFTDVEVQHIEFGPGRGEARIVLQARLYRLPSVNEISLVDEQEWHYDPDTETWFITPNFERYTSAGQPPVPVSSPVRRP